MNTSYSLTSKFQVTIPKELRDKLGLTDTDKVSFEQRGNELIIKKAISLQEVAAEMAAKFKASGLPPATEPDIKNARHNFYAKGMKW